MPTIHKLYGGSNADIWGNCTGSTYLSTQVPPRPAGQAAADGTAQHAVMEQLLLDDQLTPESFLGSTMLGVTLTADMIAAVSVALEEYMNILEDFPDDVKIFAERGVDLSDEAGGTADSLIIAGKRGAVVDFKFGMIEVEPDGMQGLFYGVCARKSEPLFANIEQLDNYIIQPAWDPATVKVSYPSSVLDRAERTFLNAIATSKKNEQIYTEGEWCTWCPGKLVCPPKLKGLDTLTRPEHILNLDELGARALKLREWIKWGEEAEARIFHELENGRRVKDWKLVQKRGRRFWKDEAKTVVEFELAKVDVEAYAPRVVVSPPEAEKLKLLGKPKVKELAEMRSSGNTIAPMSDPRPPVLPTAALAAALNRVK